jgi:hypothetical protein
MNPFRRILSVFRRHKPGMIGTPPSARQVAADPGLHAVDFSHRYTEPMNYHVENRMMELGIPTDRIGAAKYGFPRRAFWPEECTGGGNAPGRRLTVDSGVFNPALMVGLPEAELLWARARLRDRIDAVIAHEDAESLTRDHDMAEALAPDTLLPIREGARRLLRSIAGREPER